jgi:response regulator RpfG family c-di-GMP phosphodiesterase
MDAIFLEAASQISASKNFENVFLNLRYYLGKLQICEKIEFFVCRFNGETCYPKKNCKINKNYLTLLQNSKEENIFMPEGDLSFVKELEIGDFDEAVFACRFKVLEHGGEVFAFFNKGDKYDESLLLYFFKIAYAPLNLITSNSTLGLILEYAAFVAEQKDPEMMLVALADMAREFGAADRATIWIGDKSNSTLWTKVAHGIPNITIPDSVGIAGHAYKNSQTVITNDPYSDARFNPEIDKKTGYVTKSIIAVPVKNSENIVIGALQCINKLSSNEQFDKEDLSKLNLVATYIANTVELASLHKEIEDTQKEVIFTMGEVGEFRSKETGNHVKRVAEYSYVLAIACGLSKKESELLRMASPMHDIGKVAIGDEILKKPGKLTDEEFDIMKTHTSMGYEVLRHSTRKIIFAAATVAYEHHEKWNGRGYPRGIKGEDIHIFGRITALADVFDALGSDRCYKKAWELEKIYTLFKEERGEHFDPKVVDAFFDNLDKILEIRNKHKDVE